MRRIVWFVLLLFTATQVSAQVAFTPDAMWKLGRVSDPQLSPDGKTVIYNVRTYDVAANKSVATIYSIPAGGGNPVKISEDADNASSARWRPDGKKIGYMSRKSGNPQMWEMNADGSGKAQVTNVPDGINYFKYSPKMDRILYGKDVKAGKELTELYEGLPKTTGKIYDGLNVRHWDTWSDGTYSHIFYIKYNNGKTEGEGRDIMPGEEWDSPLKPFGDEDQITFTNDGNSIAYTSKKLKGTEYAKSTNSDIYLYNIADGTVKNLTEGNMGYDVNPAYSPDGRYMAYLSMERAGYEADKNRLMLLDVATGEKRELTKGWDQTTNSFAWGPDGKDIYFIAEINATIQIYVYHLAPKKKQPAIEQLTDGWHDYTGLQVAMDGKKTVLVGSKMSISAPIELYTVDMEKKKESQLTFTNKAVLDGIKMGKVEKRMIKATDGKEILTWVIYPPDFDANKKYPTLLYCQGGPQSAVSHFFSTRWNFQLMAGQGYVVVAPNRRGLPSFGQEWNDAIVGDYGGQAMKDYLSAIDEVSKEKFVDKARVGAVGASFGGYSVYWLAGHNENKRFKTFIAHCGMFNMESWYGSTEEMFFATHDQKGPYWENPENYKKFSPHTYVKNWNSPILVVHNQLDYRVPLTQGLEAFTAAQLLGLKSRLLYFPDESHWVSKPQNSILWQRTFFEWLDETLKN